jgi:hypothetical protein
MDEPLEPPHTPLSAFGPVAAFRHKRDNSGLFTASSPPPPRFYFPSDNLDPIVSEAPTPQPSTPGAPQMTSYFELQSPTIIATPTAISKPPPSPTSTYEREMASTRNSEGKGITFFLRTHKGMTHRLRSRRRLPVLVEASYGHAPLRLQSPGAMARRAGRRPPQVICVAGGVGITAALPHLRAAAATAAATAPASSDADGGKPRPAEARPTAPPPRLLWGARSAALVRALRDDVAPFAARVAVGARMPVVAELRRALAAAAAASNRPGGGGVDVVVVVSGPRAMAREARRVAGEVARAGGLRSLRFVDECFGW